MKYVGSIRFTLILFPMLISCPGAFYTFEFLTEKISNFFYTQNKHHLNKLIKSSGFAHLVS